VGMVQTSKMHDSFQAQVAQVAGQVEQSQKSNQAALEGLTRADREFSQALNGAIVPVDVINNVARAGVRIEGSQGLGSGTFFRDNNGHLYILTNDHVVADNDINGHFKVRLYSGTDETSTEVQAEVVRLSNGNPIQSPFQDGKDLAVLRVIEYPDRPAFVPPHFLTPSNFRDLSKEPLRAGEAVFAVGTPQGLNDVVSRGVVSNAHRNVPWNPNVISIQIDAPVNPGNSGGGLYDSQGRFIGVVNSSLIRRGADGLSFAISIESIKQFLNDNSVPVGPAPAEAPKG
jgi:S1-C subfamily serine protease